MQQALVFLCAAVVLIPLFQRLGLGSVLAYLIAGVLVGPFGFEFITDAESVLHFAELGVVFLLFLIGLEIQPRKLWGMRQALATLGFVQVLVCGVVFGAIASWCGLPPMTAGVVGFALSLSSTAFALQTLAEKNQFNTTFGQASFAVLLAQDLVAIPALAIIPSLAGGNSEGISVIGLVALIIGLVVASKFLMRPFFQFMAETRNKELFTTVALFIVMGVASMMVGVGLSAGLGAFIAGVLLADSEYRHQLEANLDPFKGLLMGLFFIGVGLNVDIGLIISKPILLLASTLAYLVIKSMLIYGIGRLSRLGHINSKSMALNIGQGGEFAFVIFGIIGATQMPGNDSLPFLTAVVTLSMGLSPIITALSDRLTRACPRTEVLPAFDEIKDESPEVIIAGFGRFGQIFGRFLRAQGIPFTAIDHDAGQVEMLRKFGNKVYFGDASSHSLLESAGLHRAKHFVLAIDDVEMSLKAAETVREHFPHVKIFARARNRDHAHELFARGVTNIKRETFDSALNFVGDLVSDMGMAPERVQVLLQRFKVHDEAMMKEQFKVMGDDDLYVSVSQRGQAQLEDVLSADETQSYIR